MLLLKLRFDTLLFKPRTLCLRLTSANCCKIFYFQYSLYNMLLFKDLMKIGITNQQKANVIEDTFVLVFDH